MPNQPLHLALKVLRLRKPKPRFRASHQALPQKRRPSTQVIEVIS